jgi:hypothetical protein
LAAPVLAGSSLITYSHAPGTDMLMINFCEHYGLGENVLNKFTKISYKHDHVLCFMMIDELKEMGFHWEIAGLQDAVEYWSVPRTE